MCKKKSQSKDRLSRDQAGNLAKKIALSGRPLAGKSQNKCKKGDNELPQPPKAKKIK